MSDLSPTPHLDDERLSAVMDGDASPEDERHARTCPDCAAHLAAWRLALSELATPVVVDSSRRDAAIDAALAAAAWGEAGQGEESPGGAGSAAVGSAGVGSRGAPVSLAERRPRRPRRHGLVGPRVAAAVAAVIVLAGVAVGVWRAGEGGSGHPSAAPTAATSVPPGPGTNGAGKSPTPSRTPGQPVSIASGASVHLGSYQDPGSLVAALRDQSILSSGGAGTASTSLPAEAPAASEVRSPCLSEATSDSRVAAGTRPVLAATLTYRDLPAQVFVFPVGPGHRAAVVAGGGCRLLALVTF